MVDVNRVPWWKVFLHPKVSVYIIVGCLVIMLTFVTNNNAMEIAISGIASVFIGIGVNSFSAIETHMKDKRQQKNSSWKVLRLLNKMEERLSHIKAHIDVADVSGRQELQDIGDLLDICREFIEEDTYA